MARSRPYYADQSLSAVFYDAVAAADRHIGGDVEIYAGLAGERADILELGAGTGRVTQALAELGHGVTGIDIAPAMLAQAEIRRAGLPAEVAARLNFRRGDMTSLSLGRTFGLVICPFFTLAHVPAGAAWRNTFSVAARHLAAGGLAAFHLPLRSVMEGLGPPTPEAPVMDQALPGGGRLVLYVRERSFRANLGKLEQVIEYVELSAAGQIVRRSPERLTYYVADPVPLAATAGLTPDRAAIPLAGIGEVFVFRKT